jgi:hypothetical protein
MVEDHIIASTQLGDEDELNHWWIYKYMEISFKVRINFLSAYIYFRHQRMSYWYCLSHER